MAGEEFLVGANPLLAIASGFEFVLGRGGLEGPRATGDPNEIIPQSVQPQPTMAEQMEVFGSADPYYGQRVWEQAAQLPEVIPPVVFDAPRPGTGVVPVPEPGLPVGNRPFEPIPPIEELRLPPTPPPIPSWFLPSLIGLGGLLWEGWPNELGSGELPPGTFPYGMGPPPDLVVEPLPAPVVPDVGSAGLPTIAEANARQAAANAAEATRAATQAAPVPQAPSPVASMSDRWWKWIAIGLGSGGLLSSRRRGSPAAFVDPLSRGALTSLEDALRSSLVGSSSAVQVAPGGAGAWGTSSQYCEPRPRGPRRKCLQRAPVRFSGGPRKGKAAGTKCIRYAAARSSR